MSNTNSTFLPKPTINPYHLAARLLVRQLLWDVRPTAWTSRRRLHAWHDRYSGQKAVIVCNGPSLNLTNLGALKNVFTFGLNKIDLLFERNDFRPSCIVSVNQLVLEQNQKFFNETSLPLFIESVGTRYINNRENVTFLRRGPEGFAQDCSMSVFQGHTVTYVAMQLAFHMGFREIALVGCDHSFSVTGPANKTVASGAVDDSHFDPNYFSNGAHWQLPDLLESERAYLQAKKIFSEFGGRIVNCTIGGKLELFPRMSLEDFLADPLPIGQINR
jgi:hypothetical protein